MGAGGACVLLLIGWLVGGFAAGQGSPLLPACRLLTHAADMHVPASCQDELVATEMVFSGVLSELSPAEAVALLSALVFQEKSDVEPVLSEALAQARADLFGITLQVGGGGGGLGPAGGWPAGVCSGVRGVW
jgi:hypothetical protein